MLQPFSTNVPADFTTAKDRSFPSAELEVEFEGDNYPDSFSCSKIFPAKDQAEAPFDECALRKSAAPFVPYKKDTVRLTRVEAKATSSR